MSDMPETRMSISTAELDALEREVLSMVSRAEQMVEMAVEAVTTGDEDLADQSPRRWIKTSMTPISRFRRVGRR